MAILKRHMDAIDEIKIFKDHDTANIEIFTTFIQVSFKFLTQEYLLNEDVVNDIKNLNHLTVDIEIFTADGRNVL